MISRAMKSLANEHTVRGRPTLKALKRFWKGSVCKAYERSIYERTLWVNLSRIMLGQVKKKKNHVSRPDFYKKGERAGGFFCCLLFPIACFLCTLLPSPRDTLELLGQILIKRNIRYWLNISLFNFDTHKGLTVKIYIILVCTQQQWALQVTPVGFCS